MVLSDHNRLPTGTQHFYVNETALLHNEAGYVIPIKWMLYSGKMYGHVYRLHAGDQGYIIDSTVYSLPILDFALSYTDLELLHQVPQVHYGVGHAPYHMPNPLRELAGG
jgi:hypothetical protein